MTQEPTNPYQPVASLTDENEHGKSEIQVQLTRRILRTGESRYVIYASSNRRLIASLAIITLSTILFIAALPYGIHTFITSMIMTCGRVCILNVVVPIQLRLAKTDQYEMVGKNL